MWNVPMPLATTLKRLRRLPNLRIIHLMWEQPDVQIMNALLLDPVFKAFTQLRQVEQVTVWGRESCLEETESGNCMRCYSERFLQSFVPKQRAKDKLVEQKRIDEYVRRMRRG